jgi:DUF4097 and DUF4098 domain-containing protein YvlB
MRIVTSVLGLLAAVFVMNSPAIVQRPEGRFQQTLPVSGPVQLRIATAAGSIKVRKGDSNSVRIQAQIRADSQGDAALVRDIEQNPPVRQSGNTITIGTEVRRWDHVSISYEVTVPAETRVEARSGAGSVGVYDVAGPLDAASGSGSVNAENIGARVAVKSGAGSIAVSRAGGDVSATTGSGAMEFNDIKGSAEAETGSGSISVSGATGRVRVHTGSGRIRVAKANADVDAKTGSGGIEVDGHPKSARWELRTSSGSVTVSLPSGTGFELDAHAGSGRISTAHQLTRTGASGKHELRGLVGRPDNRIFIRTTSGSVRID